MRSSFFMGYFAAEMLAGPSRPEGSSGESVVPDENNPARIATRYNMWRYQRIRPPRKCGRECTPAVVAPFPQLRLLGSAASAAEPA